MKEFNDYELPKELSTSEGQRNPYPYFKRMRDESPIRYDESRDVWDVFLYEDVNHVLTNHDVYSSEGTSHLGRHLLSADPPDHTTFRSIISEYFNARYLSKLEPLIERRTESFLTDALGDDNQMDFVEDVAIPTPISIIADMMDIPQSELRQYREWSENLLGASMEPTPEKIQESHQARVDTREEMREFFTGIVSERENNLGDDIISTLIRAEESVDIFNRELTLNTCNVVMVGGHITTSTFLTSALWTFIEHDTLPDLRSGDVPIEPALEEVLRYTTPVSRVDRAVTEDVELNGVEIPEGERLILWTASANRDERVFENADQFIPERNSEQPHLTFGRGVHTCIGNRLARLEGRIMFEILLDKFSDATIVSDTLDPFYSTMVNGIENLRVEVEA